MNMLKKGGTVVLPSIVAILLSLIIWELAVKIWGIEMWILPAPSSIIQTFIQSMHTYPEHIWMTTIEAVLGFLLGITVALILAFFLDWSPLLRKSIYPILLFSQTIPIIAIAPLLIIWFGYGLLPKVLVVALVTFFPVVVNVIEGLQSSDKDMIRLVRSMGGTQWQIFTNVRFPSALPYLFTGLRIGVTYSVLAAVISEWVGASKGLGIYLVKAQSAFATDKVFVIIALISLLSCLLFLVVLLISRLAMPWKYKQYKKRSSRDE